MNNPRKTQACISMRPGTTFNFQGETWVVRSNHTLDRTFTAETRQGPSRRKRFHYAPGQTMQVRWIPFTHRPPLYSDDNPYQGETYQ